MNNRYAHLKRTVTTGIALTVFLLIAASVAPAVEMKGMLKPKEVRALVANAKTPADHMKLARHYSAMAAKHEAEAQEHEALAAEYKRSPSVSEVKRPGAPDTAAHCQYYAEHCRKAAAEMKALAKAHEEMAKAAGK